MTQEHCKVTVEDDGTVHAVSSDIQLTILPDGEARAFNRNALKMEAGNERHIRCLVGELDGVRIYVKGSHIIMTKQDLYL